MDLHDRLARDLDARPGPDLDHLAGTSRTRGRRALRRRRALGAGATLVVLAVGGLVVGQLPGSGTDGEAPSVAADRASSRSTPRQAPAADPMGPSRHTGPATAQGGVAGLSWALQQEVAGTVSDFHGQGPVDEPEFRLPDYYAKLAFDDGSGAADVGVNVQFDDDFVSSCDAGVSRCRTETLPDGSRITRYEEITETSQGTGVRRVVDLLRADGVRVVIGATNDRNDRGTPAVLTRAEPAFTFAQLERVVRRDFWGTELPTSFLEAGDQLAPFDYSDGIIDGTPLPPPTN